MQQHGGFVQPGPLEGSKLTLPAQTLAGNDGSYRDQAKAITLGTGLSMSGGVLRAVGSAFDGAVATWADLPVGLEAPVVESVYLVRSGSGVWLLNRKKSGLWQRVAATGDRTADWSYLGEWLEEFSDANFEVWHDDDTTRGLKFSLADQPTGTTVTVRSNDLETLGTMAAGWSGVSGHLLRTDNPHGVTAAQVGLGSVDNTRDADKPVSTAQAAAIGARAPLVHGHASEDISDSTYVGRSLLTAASAAAQRNLIGVTPWATNQWTNGTTDDVPEGARLYFTADRADARIAAQKGQAEGLAPLDAGGKVPSANLPDSIAQADDAARLGGQLPSYYAQAGHVHNYAGSSTPGGAATYAGLLEPISGQAGYKLGYAADGARIHPGSWGRVVMRYDANGETYGVRVDQADMVSDPGYCRIAYPGGGVSVAQISQPVGAIAIRLPVGMTDTMARITVKVYEFLSGSSFECHVSGYNYTQGNTWVNNPTAYIVGNPNVSRQLTVRLGYDSALDKAIIYIGELNSVWAHPQIYVTEVLCGYSGYGEVWASGWQIGFESSAFKNVTATITDCQVGYKIPNPSADGYLLSSTAGGVRSWVVPYSHPPTHAQSVIDSAAGWITEALNGKQAAGNYLTTTGTAADSAKLGGVAAGGYSVAGHTHNYAGSTTPGGDASRALVLAPLSGYANYRLAYTADGACIHREAYGRVVMSSSENGETYGVRVGQADMVSDPNFHRITNPGGATFVSQSAQQIGAIAVHLPVGMTNTMVRVVGRVYEFATNSSFDFVICGYAYEVGNTWGNYPTAYITGDPRADRRFAVRFGYDSLTGKAVLYLGELSTIWSYPQVFITEVQLGYDGMSEQWAYGWNISFESTAFSNVTATISDCQVGYRTPNMTAFDALAGTGVPVRTGTNTWELRPGKTASVVIGGTTLNFVNGLLVSYLST